MKVDFLQSPRIRLGLTDTSVPCISLKAVPHAGVLVNSGVSLFGFSVPPQAGVPRAAVCIGPTPTAVPGVALESTGITSMYPNINMLGLLTMIGSSIFSGTNVVNGTHITNGHKCVNAIGLTVSGFLTVHGPFRVNGHASWASSIVGTTKLFDIKHPIKENHRLAHGCLEGPEVAVYVRGRTTESVIELPEYWTGLVDEESITVNITPIGNKKVWVEEINNNKIFVGYDKYDKNVEYFYTVLGERKDVNKLIIEYEGEDFIEQEDLV